MQRKSPARSKKHAPQTIEDIQPTKLPSFIKALPWILIISGSIGMICSLVLTYDQIGVWQHPHFIPACSLNPVVSCGAVINSKLGHVFGLPAPFLGLSMFPVLATIGITMLAGAKLKRWFWLGLQVAVSGGVIFALWLFWLSMYRIHALCPFCLVTDVAVYASTWYVTLYNLETGAIHTPASLQKIINIARKHHIEILMGVYLLLSLLILHHFWYYYGSYFH